MSHPIAKFYRQANMNSYSYMNVLCFQVVVKSLLYQIPKVTQVHINNSLKKKKKLFVALYSIIPTCIKTILGDTKSHSRIALVVVK